MARTLRHRDKVRETIDTAYVELIRACDQSYDAATTLVRAYEAALEGEKRHRKGRPGPWAQSCSTAARYFVIKWVIDHTPGRKFTAAQLNGYRLDCFYAMAIRDRLHQAKRYPWRLPGKKPWNPIAHIDYQKDILGSE